MKNIIKCFLIICSLVFFVFCKKDAGPPGDSDTEVIDSTGENTPTPDPPAEPEEPTLIQIEKALMIDPALVKTKTKDETIMDELVYYMDHTPEGESIHISIYLFSHGSVIKALERAYERGVEVHLMIDSGRSDSRSNNINTFIKFRNLLEGASEMVVVNNSTSASAINHEKYVLFSKVDIPPFGSAENLIFATSHNFIPSATKKIQDAIVMTNDALYEAFLSNWNEIKLRAKDGMEHFTYSNTNIGDSIKAIFFPRRLQGAWDGVDDIVEHLSLLDKEGYSKDTVNVFMAFFTRLEIAQKLKELQEAGVTVQVITRNNGDVSNAVKAQLKEIHDLGGYVKNLDISKQNLHSKCMLIKGTIDGAYQELILTGSHNYTNPALKNNNEFLLILKNSVLFDKYWDYFKNMQSTLDDFSGWGD